MKTSLIEIPTKVHEHDGWLLCNPSFHDARIEAHTISYDQKMAHFDIKTEETGENLEVVISGINRLRSTLWGEENIIYAITVFNFKNPPKDFYFPLDQVIQYLFQEEKHYSDTEISKIIEDYSKTTINYNLYYMESSFGGEFAFIAENLKVFLYSTD